MQSLFVSLPEIGNMVEPLLVSTGIVALAEIGDKTQLLALLLAARFRKPWPIIWGIVLATIANHFAAGALGKWVSTFFSEATLSWVLAVCFIAMAAWTLIPDEVDDDEAGKFASFGPFLTTLIAFFLAEIGDKTQIATVMLAAQYEYFVVVVMGTTLGMLLANVPVVLIGHFSADKLPLTLIHRIAALCFLGLGLYAAWNAASLSGFFG